MSTGERKARALAKRYATQGKYGLAEAWLTAAEHHAKVGDAECSGCGARYFSAEGHPKFALCSACGSVTQRTDGMEVVT